MTRMKRIALRALKWLIGIELAYLLLINVALQIGFTQDLVNKIRPEKFQVHWDSAWSWYPFRVSASGIHASGQSRSQQWQVQADNAAGSIRLLPLILKRVYINSISAENVDYRQRPRLKEDRDYSRVMEHFPDIEGRKIIPAETGPRKQKRPWKIFLSNARASGEHSFWIYNLKGTGSGRLKVDLSLQTRGGPFSLDATELAVQLGPAYANTDIALYRGGEVTGSLGFLPFVPRENRGLGMLPYLWLDAGLDLQVGSLGFINLFTANLGNLVISGAGKVQGHIKAREGYLKAGTALTATADALSVVIRDMDVTGMGRVYIHTPEDKDVPLGLDINYDALSVTRIGDDGPFLAGDSLALALRGSNFVAPDQDMNLRKLLADERAMERRKNNTVDLRVDDATLLDMAIINDYMPDDMPLQFTGGTANLQADLFFGVNKISGLVELDSDSARIAVDEQQLQADLDADIVVADGIPREYRVDVSGSRIVLDKVRVEGDNQNFNDNDWSAELEMLEAEAVVQPALKLHARAGLRVSDTRPLVAMFDNRDDPPRWVSKLITLTDLQGEASLEMEDDRVRIPLARVTSDKAEVAAKALFTGGVRNSAVYVRYKKLDMLLRTENNERNIDVVNVLEKFDAFTLPDD